MGRIKNSWLVRRLGALAVGVWDTFLRDNKVIPAILAVVALFVFSWIVAGAFAGSSKDAPVANRDVAQTPQGEQRTSPPAVENPNVDSYAAYQSKDPFRPLFKPAGSTTGGSGATGGSTSSSNGSRGSTSSGSGSSGGGLAGKKSTGGGPSGRSSGSGGSGRSHSQKNQSPGQGASGSRGSAAGGQYSGGQYGNGGNSQSSGANTKSGAGRTSGPGTAPSGGLFNSGGDLPVPPHGGGR